MFYTFDDLTADEVKLIGHALGKLPYDVVQPLLAKLQTQINAAESATRMAQSMSDASDDTPDSASGGVSAE